MDTSAIKHHGCEDGISLHYLHWATGLDVLLQGPERTQRRNRTAPFLPLAPLSHILHTERNWHLMVAQAASLSWPPTSAHLVDPSTQERRRASFPLRWAMNPHGVLWMTWLIQPAHLDSWSDLLAWRWRAMQSSSGWRPETISEKESPSSARGTNSTALADSCCCWEWYRRGSHQWLNSQMKEMIQYKTLISRGWFCLGFCFGFSLKQGQQYGWNLGQARPETTWLDSYRKWISVGLLRAWVGLGFGLWVLELCSCR